MQDLRGSECLPPQSHQKTGTEAHQAEKITTFVLYCLSVMSPSPITCITTSGTRLSGLTIWVYGAHDICTRTVIPGTFTSSSSLHNTLPHTDNLHPQQAALTMHHTLLCLQFSHTHFSPLITISTNSLTYRVTGDALFLQTAGKLNRFQAMCSSRLHRLYWKILSHWGWWQVWIILGFFVSGWKFQLSREVIQAD